MKNSFWLVFVLVLSSCGAAKRATVHSEDVNKVYPWPNDQQSVQIRVKPQTTMANTCFLFGSFEEIEVTPETTFYITNHLGKSFAYTPSRSPARRIDQVQDMEIRWPQKSVEEEKPAPKPDPKKKENTKAKPKLGNRYPGYRR